MPPPSNLFSPKPLTAFEQTVGGFRANGTHTSATTTELRQNTCFMRGRLRILRYRSGDVPCPSVDPLSLCPNSRSWTSCLFGARLGSNPCAGPHVRVHGAAPVLCAAPYGSLLTPREGWRDTGRLQIGFPRLLRSRQTAVTRLPTPSRGRMHQNTTSAAPPPEP